MYSHEQVESFLAGQDFNALLKGALNLHYAKRGKINLADFSRRAGFASRSYLSEVLTGKKGLSRDALTKIRTALKLPKPFLDVLEYSAYREFAELKPRHIQSEALAEKIEHAAALVKNIPATKTNLKVTPRYIRSSILYRVYAGLGSIEDGATLSDIMNRTGLPESTITSCLNAMKEFKIIEERQGRFLVKNTQLDVFGLTSRDGLSELVSDVCRDLRNNRDRIIDEPKNTIFYTAFSTNEAKLPELKKRLQAAVFDVLDEFQVDDGDCVRQIFFTQS